MHSLVSFFSVPHHLPNFWHSTVFYLNYNSASLLYLIAFALLSVTAIVFASVSAPKPQSQSSRRSLIRFISASPIDEINHVTNFVAYTISSSHLSIPPCVSKEQLIENPVQPRPIHQSPFLSDLEQSFSHVTLTFGSDKPEVYLKMAKQTHTTALCRCPCNHQSPELANLPHASNTSTVSSNVSVPTSTHTQNFHADSLYSVASKKQNLHSEPSLPLCAETSASSMPVCQQVMLANQNQFQHYQQQIHIVKTAGPCRVDKQCFTSTNIVSKNEDRKRLAYMKMKTMIAIVDPALLFQWIALKIALSIHILFKGIFDHTADNAVVRRFHG